MCERYNELTADEYKAVLATREHLAAFLTAQGAAGVEPNVTIAGLLRITGDMIFNLYADVPDGFDRARAAWDTLTASVLTAERFMSICEKRAMRVKSTPRES